MYTRIQKRQTNQETVQLTPLNVFNEDVKGSKPLSPTIDLSKK